MNDLTYPMGLFRRLHDKTIGKSFSHNYILPIVNTQDISICYYYSVSFTQSGLDDNIQENVKENQGKKSKDLYVTVHLLL